MRPIYTIGHSTRSWDEFAALILEHHVQLLVDVRRFPGSRRHPQFGQDNLQRELKRIGVEYLWLEALGGRRKRLPNSPHIGWQVAAFAAYADHMDTDEFKVAGRDLLRHAEKSVAAIMCAEARPEQCHRRLISDWLLARDIPVIHVLSKGRTQPHKLPPFARIDGDRVIYDQNTTLELRVN